MKVSKGSVCVFQERVPLRTHQLLRKELSRGRKALYISKNAPDILKSQLDFDRSILKTKWLSTRIYDDTIPPMNLSEFERIISDFLSKNKGGIVVLNGLDVLEKWNGNYPVIKVLRRMEKLVEIASGNLIISLDPKDHYETSLKRLESISDQVVYSGS